MCFIFERRKEEKLVIHLMLLAPPPFMLVPHLMLLIPHLMLLMIPHSLLWKEKERVVGEGMVVREGMVVGEGSRKR